jgi:N-acetylmuramic acid 6-phosphate etherase
MPRPHATSARGFLGLEAGGTRTTAAWQDDAPTCQAQTATFSPANLQLLSENELTELLTTIARAFPLPRAVAIGMAGTRTPSDRDRLAAATRRTWPGTPCHITHDLDVALAAAQLDESPARVPTVPHVVPVLILSGTGSCAYARNRQGNPVQAGGWGHLLGDQGSGYAIALAALRSVILRYDLTRRWPALGSRLLTALHLNEANQLIPWMAGASKAEVAALAPTVFAQPTDPLARCILHQAAQDLANLALAAARQVADPASPVRFILAGGVLTRQPRFSQRLGRLLTLGRAKSTIALLRHPGVEGALSLARQLVPPPPPVASGDTISSPTGLDLSRPRSPESAPLDPQTIIPRTLALPPTEERHPDSMDLDRLSLSKSIDLMLAQLPILANAVRGESTHIERAIHLVTRALQSGGRLFYVGAGTSGRLGILDASECPPTFRSRPEQIQGIIAGGAPAVFRAAEGAEDDFHAGSRAIHFRGIQRRDVVMGIAASGRTPFIWGALAAARMAGSRTILLAFNPHLRFQPGHRPDVVISPHTGPEILTGSTRLKAGTATKEILNLLTTLVMVRMGKVRSNLMVDLHPSNSKLRERAVRITSQLTGSDPENCRRALAIHQWTLAKAIRHLENRQRNQRKSRPPS